MILISEIYDILKESKLPFLYCKMRPALWFELSALWPIYEQIENGLSPSDTTPWDMINKRDAIREMRKVIVGNRQCEIILNEKMVDDTILLEDEEHTVIGILLDIEYDSSIYFYIKKNG